MNLQSRLTVGATGLLLPAVVLTGTAYAKRPPEPGTRSGPVGTESDPVGAGSGPLGTVAPIAQSTGLPTWQVIALVVTAAILAAVLTMIATHRRPRVHAPYAKSAA